MSYIIDDSLILISSSFFISGRGLIYFIYTKREKAILVSINHRNKKIIIFIISNFVFFLYLFFQFFILIV